jgi:hypothetical protein
MIKFNFKICFTMFAMVFLTGCTSTLSTQQLDAGVGQRESFTKVVSEVEKDDSSQSEMWYWLNLAKIIFDPPIIRKTAEGKPSAVFRFGRPSRKNGGQKRPQAFLKPKIKFRSKKGYCTNLCSSLSYYSSGAALHSST